MSVVINGTGSISGLSNVGGISSAQSGSIIQTVNATYATQTTNASTSVYANTGLTASITPQFATSKILVLVNHNGNIVIGNAGGGAIRFKLQRNGSDITFIDGMTSYISVSSNSGSATCSTAYLDSPATTSSTAYSTQFMVRNSGTAYVQYNDGTGYQAVSTITLMEIAG